LWWRELGWRYVVGIVALVFALFPILWVFSASINPSGTLSGQRLIPTEATLRNYERLFDGTIPYARWFANTLIVAGTAAIGTVFLCALGAYAFSRLRFTGRRVGLLSLLLVQMFPQLLAVVAIFLFMLRIGELFPALGLGTQAGLILIYLGGALGINTWLMKGFFDTIPHDLDESAKVDGATHAQIFFKHHPAAGRTRARRHRPPVVHLQRERVPHRQRHPHRRELLHPVGGARPVHRRALRPALGSLRRGDHPRRAARHRAVRVPPAVHRQRPDRRLGQGLSGS
jgi:ABC-type spermidine/putrescine transport system permease subunit II